MRYPSSLGSCAIRRRYQAGRRPASSWSSCRISASLTIARTDEADRLGRQERLAATDDGQLGQAIRGIGDEGREDPPGQARWTGAVPGEAVGEVDVAAVARGDLGESVAGDIDRSAPGVDEAHVAKHREEMVEVRDDALDRATVMGERALHRAAVAGRADTRAERDPPVTRRPEVADREARVAEQLPARPAELGKAVGDRLGDDHVAAPGEDAAAEVWPAGWPTR